MRKLLLLAALTVLPLSAQAQWSLGGRLGYGLAMGDADGSLSMSDYVKSQIPLQLDVMYRVSPEVSVGGYLSYGFGQLGGSTADLCDFSGADCSASSLRIGAQLAYTFQASPTAAPWIGAGIGFESTSLDGGAATVDVTGFEFLNLQAGYDFKTNEQFAVGPYAQFSIGQYSSVEGNDIADKKMHQWFSFGVRGKFDL